MGNITRASLKRTVADPGITATLEEINERRFGGFFKIVTCATGGEDGGVWWEIYAPGLQFRGKEMTWSLWDFYRESPRRIGGKAPRPNYLWAQWAWWQFLCELCDKFGGVITDEGIEESIKPAEYLGETLDRMIERRCEWSTSEAYKAELRGYEVKQVPDALWSFGFPGRDRTSAENSSAPENDGEGTP